MVLKSLKKSLTSIVLASSLALTPVAAQASPPSPIEQEQKMATPAHIDWIFNNKEEARTLVLGANMVMGCVKSGIGSYMYNQGFLEGCVKGAFAGAVTYLGEHIATFNDVPMVGGLGKLIHDLGVSMSDNVMRGKPMFSQYQTELGPVTFIFQDSPIPRIVFTFTPMYAMVRNFADGQEFDFEKSLYNLTPVFKKPLEKIDFGHKATFVPGYTDGNVISYTEGAGRLLGYKENSSDYDKLVLSHEFNHVLFWSKFRFGSDLLNLLPTEEIPLVPEMEEIQLYWNVGQDVTYKLLTIFAIDKSLYYFGPCELEAFSMQRH